MLLFCSEKEKNKTKTHKNQTPKQQLSLKCKQTTVGLWELSVIPSKEIQIPSCRKQTPQNRNQGLSLSFCKCFFSQHQLQIQLSHFFPEQAKCRKTKWHSRFAWNSSSVCHHQHGNCMELDDMTPTPPLFTSTSMGITFGSLHFHLKNLSFYQSKPCGINSCYPGAIHPNHLLPCYLHWKNVISWKNKASINPCGHFVAIKSFFPHLFKPTQSSIQQLIIFPFCGILHTIK